MPHALRRFSPALVLLFALSATASEPVARVVGVAGEAWLATDDGSRVALTVDATIGAGARIVTGEGRVRFEFVDGGLVSVQPATTFRVERYAYAGAEDGSEWALFELLRGGLRVTSGAIGHARPERYRLRTVFATIGIRGTAYNVLACDGVCELENGTRHPAGLHVETTEGTIFVENPAGLLDVPAGRAAYVSTPATAPAFTQFSPDFVALPPPVGDEPVAGQRGAADDGVAAGAKETSVADAATAAGSPIANDARGPRIVTAIGVRDLPTPVVTKRAVIAGSSVDFASRIAQVNGMLNASFGWTGTATPGTGADAGTVARQRAEALERTAATGRGVTADVSLTGVTPRVNMPRAAMATAAPAATNTAIARAAVISRVTATVAHSAVASTRINAVKAAVAGAASAEAGMGTALGP